MKSEERGVGRGESRGQQAIVLPTNVVSKKQAKTQERAARQEEQHSWLWQSRVESGVETGVGSRDRYKIHVAGSYETSKNSWGKFLQLPPRPSTYVCVCV